MGLKAITFRISSGSALSGWSPNNFFHSTHLWMFHVTTSNGLLRMSRQALQCRMWPSFPMLKAQALKTAKKLLDLLSPAERRGAALLLAMILIMALLDVAGVASIMPFMAVLANPTVVESNPYLAEINQVLGFNNTKQFLFFLGLFVFFALVVSVSFKALTTYALLRFTNMRSYSLGRRLVEGYLHQPYEWFLNRHSADLGKTVLSEVDQVISQALVPAMQLIAQGAVVVALLLLLLAVDPELAIASCLGLGLTYAVIYWSVHRYLGRLGADRLRANRARFQVLSEAFGGIKELKVAGLEESFLRRFEDPARLFATRRATSHVIVQLPRYVLEIVAFGGMLFVILYLMHGEGGLERALPVIGLYAFACYRLMPALYSLYGQLATLRFANAALDNLHLDISNLAPRPERLAGGHTFVLERAITLRDITYTYPNAASSVVTKLSLEFPGRTTVGLVGATGSGKTTTVDIILGLLRAQEGGLYVDDIEITPHNVRYWQQAIGYVPQHIFLADDTVAANIAFGIPKENINQKSVEWAAGIAKLHDFVSKELPQGYETLIGERGVRLSGGQRQRIGIARALYHNPQVLILDEATSALDNLTEQAVMEAIHALNHEITIILIAHRLSTVRECDRIYLLEKGRLAGQGTYEELMSSNAQFSGIAQAGD